MINKKIKLNIVQTATLMLALTLISKVFGFAREMVMAGLFGTSYITDAYVMAQSIPNIIFAGIFGAVSTAYLPLFSKYTERDGKESGVSFTIETMNILLWVSVISSLAGIIFSDQLVSVFASGFKGETFRLTSFFVKVTFSYVLFISISDILEAFLRYKNVFLLPIIIGYLQNLIIITVIVISAYYNYYLLSFGMLIAYIVRLIIIAKASVKNGMKFRLTCKTGNAAQKIVALSLPVFLGSGINQINTFVDKTLASGLVEGSISALNYGHLIIGLVKGLTVTIIMKITFPKMTRAVSLGDSFNYNKILSTATNVICIIIIPCTIGILFYSSEIVRIIYQRGAFGEAAAQLTENALFYYSIGLLFYVLNGVFTDAFYSMQDMRTPVRYAVVGLIVNIVLNLILVRHMALSGLALATSIASVCNTMLLYYGLKKKYKEVVIVQSFFYLIKILFGAIIAVGFSYLFFNRMETFKIPLMFHFTAAVITACIAYLFILKLFRIKELELLRQLIKI